MWVIYLAASVAGAVTAAAVVDWAVNEIRRRRRRARYGGYLL